MNYNKWDHIIDDEDEGNSPESSVADATAGWNWAESAKSTGQSASPVDDLLTLKGDSSLAELKAKMMNLPADAKHKFMEQISSPGVLEQLTQKVDALRQGDPVAAGKLLVGMRVTLTGLSAKPELNGRSGRVVEFVEAKGRCAVQLDGMKDKLLLKPQNLDRETKLA